MKNQITIPTELLQEWVANNRQTLETAETVYGVEYSNWLRGRADAYQTLLDVWGNE